MGRTNIFHKNVDNPDLRRYHCIMNRKGMSLIELMVSMVVLSVAALAVAAAVSLVNNEKMRSGGGSTLELQALGYARQTLELLRNSVSSQEAGGQPGEALVDTSYVHPCATAVNTVCNNTGTLKSLAIPASSLLSAGGVRFYRVWDISSGTGVTGTDVAYKKVTVSVDWTE